MQSKRTQLSGLVLNPTASTPTEGCVALLDALGARSYGLEEAAVFLGARDQIVEDVRKAATETPRIESDNFRVFVFNDTIVLTYPSWVARMDPLPKTGRDSVSGRAVPGYRRPNDGTSGHPSVKGTGGSSWRTATSRRRVLQGRSRFRHTCVHRLLE